MITDAQLRMLRRLDHHGAAKELAAVKSGMDPKTARKYRRLGKLPSEVKIMDRDWLTRLDPFAEVWPELQAQLQLHPGLEAKTLFCPLPRSGRILARMLPNWRPRGGRR